MSIIKEYTDYLKDIGELVTEKINSANGVVDRWIVRFKDYEVSSDHYEENYRLSEDFISQNNELYNNFCEALNELDKHGEIEELSKVYGVILHIKRNYSKLQIYNMTAAPDVEYESRMRIVRRYLTDESYKQYQLGFSEDADNFEDEDWSNEDIEAFWNKLDEESKKELDVQLKRNDFIQVGRNLLSFLRLEKEIKLDRLIQWLESKNIDVQVQIRDNDKPKAKDKLLQIFKMDADAMNAFLKRCTDGGLEGIKICTEVNALLKLKIIEDYESYKPLYDELKNRGFDVKSRQNWNNHVGKNLERTPEHIKKQYEIYRKDLYSILFKA